MKTKLTPIEKKRAAWIKKHPFYQGMPFEESLRLNEELVRRFPMTPEEMEQRAKEMVGEEFVL